MPDLTCTISPRDQGLLETYAAQLKVTPAELATAIIQRTLTKSVNTTDSGATVSRILRQNRRRLALLNHLKTLPPGTKVGQLRKRQLAEQWGVDERTLYRDFDVIEEMLRVDGQEQAKKTLELMVAGAPIAV